MKWLLKISYSWGDEEPYQEFNSFEEAWDTAKKDACNEAEIASIEANDEKCEIGLTFEKEEDRGRISLHYTYDNSYCYYDVLPLPRGQILNLYLTMKKSYFIPVQEL